jgi:hypothetical protein
MTAGAGGMTRRRCKKSLLWSLNKKTAGKEDARPTTFDATFYFLPSNSDEKTDVTLLQLNLRKLIRVGKKGFFKRKDVKLMASFGF